MLELLSAGGYLMVPIVACSVVAFAIVLERFWALQRSKVIPGFLLVEIRKWRRDGGLDAARLNALESHSPLGRVLAAGLPNGGRDRAQLDREQTKERVEDAGRHVGLELERYLTALGTIAAISPLLGLLGTVVGMIEVFAVITAHGAGDPTVLSSGISQALVTTAGGLVVAIPALIFHRYFRARVRELVFDMERESLKLVDLIHDADPDMKPAQTDAVRSVG